jgi:DNA-binding transcriptional ArsR family regulator
MDERNAIEGFGALAQPTRLAAFRLLIEAGPAGLAAGALAERLGTPHNTLSTHLAILVRARLVTSRREGRSILYAPDLDGVPALLAFLVGDCCSGRPELCAPLGKILERGACC